MKCNAVQIALNTGQSYEKRGLTSWRIRQHLRSCSACQKAHNELLWLADRTAEWRKDDPPPAMKGRIHQALEDSLVPASPVGQPACGYVNWIVTLKENPKMKLRIGFTGAVLLVASGGLMTTSLRHASALTRFAGMKQAMHNVRTAHVSIWENTAFTDRHFYRREFWVQGNQLRQYIPGKLWQISTPDTNWYYSAEKDRLERQAHKQMPVKFDFSQLLREVKGFRKDGQEDGQEDGRGVLIESEPDTVLRGRQVAQIQVTELAPTVEQLAEEQAQEEEATREQEDNFRLKGVPPPITEVRKMATTILHSRRHLYWVDKATDLPLHSEDYVEENGKWTLECRSDYSYNEPFAANLFAPQDLMRVGRQECQKQKQPH